jgi:hypothetical protein
MLTAPVPAILASGERKVKSGFSSFADKMNCLHIQYKDLWHKKKEQHNYTRYNLARAVRITP